MTIREALTQAASLLASPTPQLDAEVLLGSALGKDKTWVLSHLDDEMPQQQEQRFFALIERRQAGEPVAYLTGRKEFYGRPFTVTRDVLIPRPESELIIDLMKEHWRHDRRLRIIDVGTGSGCLAITAALEFENAKVIAIDQSPRALVVAQSNAVSLGAEKVTFLGSNLLSEVERGEGFDIIMANLPYLVDKDLLDSPTAQDLSFEPRAALIADNEDGLSLIKACTKQSITYLKPGGRLYLEMMPDQVELFLQWLKTEQLAFNTSVAKDLAGYDRIIVLQIQ